MLSRVRGFSEENSNPENCGSCNLPFIFPSVTPYEHTDALEPFRIMVPLFSHFLACFEHGKVESMLSVLNNNLKIHIQTLGQIHKKKFLSFYG